MRIQQKEKIIRSIAALRADNYSYGTIAEKLGLNANTVKSLCLRNGIKAGDNKTKSKLQSKNVYVCKYCGKAITNDWNRKGKVFCSDSCRTKYHNEKKHEARIKERERIRAEMAAMPGVEDWLVDAFLGENEYPEKEDRRLQNQAHHRQKEAEKPPEKTGLLAPGELSLDNKEVDP